MELTIYQREVARLVARRFKKLPPEDLVAELCRMGLIDHSICKVLAVRTWVAEATATGVKKLDAMWTASEKFCTSYEYIRKCIYYYKDINL